MNISNNSSSPHPTSSETDISWYMSAPALFIFTLCILFCMCYTPTPKQPPKRIISINV